MRYSKSFQDYFRIPILLRGAIQYASHYAALLNQYSTPLVVGEQSYDQEEQSIAQLLSSRSENCTQKVQFMTENFQNQWPEFQVIYTIKFVIALYQKDNEKSMSVAIQKLKKITKDEGMQLIGIIILPGYTGQIEIENTMFVIIPQKLPDCQLWNFLQPWILTSLRIMQKSMIRTVNQLKMDDNSCIVFNRLEQRSQPKIMRKKKKGRCIKLCGDYFLLLRLHVGAFEFFIQAQEILRKAEDHLWLLGCIQGKIACLTTGTILEIEKEDIKIQQMIEQCFILGKKIKIPLFKTQNFLKLTRLFVDEHDRFDDIIQTFLSNNLNLYHQEENFYNLLIEIGSLYAKHGFPCRKNYCYFIASQLEMLEDRELRRLLLEDIVECQHLQKWHQLYTQTIKLLINESNSRKSPWLYFQLLSKCSNMLTSKQRNKALDYLNFNYFDKQIIQSLQMLQIKQFLCIQSLHQPKYNSISFNEKQNKSKVSGIFLGWKKQNNVILVEQGEQIVFNISIVNKMPFLIQLQIKFTGLHSNLSIVIPSNQSIKSNIQVCSDQLKAKNIIITQIEINIWNFQYIFTLRNPIEIQIYDRQPNFKLEITDILQIQQSSELSLNFYLIRLNAIQWATVKISISFYYELEVGFQQNQFKFTIQQVQIKQNSQQNMTLIQSENEKAHLKNQGSNIILISKKMKAHRRYLKKMEFILQFVRTNNSKYQKTKKYTCFCKVINSIWCTLQSITTPLLSFMDELNPYNKFNFNCEKNYRIIEDEYMVKVYFHKNKDNLVPYQIMVNQKQQQYVLSDKTQILINIKQQKKKINENLKLNFHWRNLLQSRIKGSINLQVPFHNLMITPNKEVKMLTEKIKNERNTLKKLKITYEIKGQQLQHQFILNSLSVEIERTYFIEGKIKILSKANKINNTLMLYLQQNISNNYRPIIIFEDGWIYWHNQLIDNL